MYTAITTIVPSNCDQSDLDYIQKTAGILLEAKKVTGEVKQGANDDLFKIKRKYSKPMTTFALSTRKFVLADSTRNCSHSSVVSPLRISLEFDDQQLRVSKKRSNTQEKKRTNLLLSITGTQGSKAKTIMWAKKKTKKSMTMRNPTDPSKRSCQRKKCHLLIPPLPAKNLWSITMTIEAKKTVTTWRSPSRKEPAATMIRISVRRSKGEVDEEKRG
jgi:hypothetical protein